MNVSRYMTQKLITATPKMSVKQAFLLMPTVLVYEMLCFWLHALLGHPMPLHWQALPGSVLAWWPLEWLLQPLWAEDRKPDRLPS